MSYSAFLTIRLSKTSSRGVDIIRMLLHNGWNFGPDVIRFRIATTETIDDSRVLPVSEEGKFWRLLGEASAKGIGFGVNLYFLEDGRFLEDFDDHIGVYITFNEKQLASKGEIEITAWTMFPRKWIEACKPRLSLDRAWYESRMVPWISKCGSTQDVAWEVEEGYE